MIPKIITVGHIFGKSVILTVVQKTIKAGATGKKVDTRPYGAHCTFEIALSGRQCSLLCLCAPFPHASTKVSCVGFVIRFPSGGFTRRCYATPQNDIKCVARSIIKKVCKFFIFLSNKQTLILFRTKYSVIASVAWQSPGRARLDNKKRPWERSFFVGA